MADRFKQPAAIEPVDPFEHAVFDGPELSPGASEMDDLRFVKAVDGCGQGVVIAVADAANQWFDPSF